MKKQLINLMFTALTFGLMMSLNTMTAEAEAEANSSVRISETGSISLMSDNADKENITAVQLSIKVEPEEVGKVAFDFNQDAGVKVFDFRYHEDTKIMNIYIADSKPIFKSSDSLEIGTVFATDADNNIVDVQVDVVEDSLKLVAQNNLTERTFVVEDEKEAENNPPPVNDDPPKSDETTDEGESVELKKTYATAYMITIPKGTDTLKENSQFNVSADSVLLEYGDVLEVSVTSENGWKLKDKKYSQNESGISYRMGYGSEKTEITQKTEKVLSVTGGAESGEVNLTVISVDNPDMAGTFADTLTFGVRIDR